MQDNVYAIVFEVKCSRVLNVMHTAAIESESELL